MTLVRKKLHLVLTLLCLSPISFAIDSEDESASIERPRYQNETYKGTGVIIGKFDFISPKDGWIIRTPELRIKVGELKAEGKYLFEGISEPYSAATEFEGIVKKLKGVPKAQPYVFEFVRKPWFDPEFEDHHIQIVDAYPLKKRADLGIPLEMVENIIERENETHVFGKIIKVERKTSTWIGPLDVDCEMTISKGFLKKDGTIKPIRPKGENSKTIADLTKRMTFNVYGENMCTFVQNAAKTGAMMQIWYSNFKDAKWRIDWDENDLVAHRVRMLEGKELIKKFYQHKLDSQIIGLMGGQGGGNLPMSGGANDMNYEVIARYVEDRILNNSEFRQNLAKLVKELMYEIKAENAQLGITD